MIGFSMLVEEDQVLEAKLIKDEHVVIV